jgi:putative ABC transport system substrate-binding protein
MYKNILIILIFLLTCPSHAAARDLLVVQAHRAKPYSEAVRGIRSSCGARLKDVAISELSAEDIVAEVRRQKPDVVVALGMEALLKLRKVREIPIVYSMVLNPAAALRGEKNITGVSMMIPPEKQLATLQTLLPWIRRIGLIYNPRNTARLVARAQRSASRLGIELTALKVSKPDDVPEQLERLKEVDVLWMVPDSTVVTPECVEYLFLFSLSNRIPIITFSKKYLDLGALVSMEVNPFELGRQTGQAAASILSGTPVKNVPELDAENFEIGINKKIASKMGLRITGEAFNRLRKAN